MDADQPITQMLQDAAAGDPAAVDRLLQAVYGELKRIAVGKLFRESGSQPFEPTVLVHEAYLRLIGTTPLAFENRRHFFGAAAEAMRRVLIDQARQRRQLKRGGNLKRVDLDTETLRLDHGETCDELLAIDEALTRLEELDPRKAKLVKLRFYGGLTQAQAADLLGISRSTADNDWLFARAWLRDAIEESS